VNAVLCLGALACWLAWDTIRHRLGFVAAASRLLLLLLPMAAMSFPIMMWNLKLTGSPMLRTQGTECLYIGNEPDFGGLIVSPGWEWTNLETKPLLEGRTLALERGSYWLDKTIDIVRTRPVAWLALQGKKLLMQLGNYEVSQEIDTYRFKNSSSLLGCVLWPGFGYLFPLAVAGIVLAISRKEARAVPVWACAAVYLISILPFQVASRFRLLLVVPLLPFAAAFLVDVVDRIRSRQFRPLLVAGAGLLVAYAVVLPDYTGLAGRNIIDHWLFVGKKRMSCGDIDGAINAYTISAEQLPGRVDSMLQMGYAHLWTNGIEKASASFTEARRRNESCAEALLGLAGCDARSGKDDAAVTRCREVLQRWPNSREALRLLQGIYFRQENWPTLELVLNQFRTYVNWPPDTAFQLARISVLQGNSNRALTLYEELAAAGHIGSFDRSRALLLAGILKWRTEGDVQGATLLWRRSLEMGDKNISPLAACLLGKIKPDELAIPGPGYDWKEAGMYRFYVLGLSAWMRGEMPAAVGQLERVVATRHADKLKQHEMSLLESWAVADLAKIRQ
ncbi:MAG: tetratricopeptide repeat protein, partial [bacterium]